MAEATRAVEEALAVIRQVLPRLRGLDVELANQFEEALDAIDPDEFATRAALESFARAVITAAKSPDFDNHGMRHVKADTLLEIAEHWGMDTRP